MAYHSPPAVWSRGLWALLLSSGLLLGVLRGSSEAQITLDGSLGPRSPLQGPNYRIGAELGQIRGSNLFHSFGAFNVPRGGSATFAGPNTIANIVGRVTGGEPSSINGALRSEIAGANLFLLNPSGVLFGPDASLNVSGSFHVSTADFLRLADGAQFHANLGQASRLTVAPPAAFGFLGSNPAAITIQGSPLRVHAGETLSVVGGDLEIMGNAVLTARDIPTLHAPGGRIQLASVASPGEVRFSPLELAPDLQVDGFARLGRIELSKSAFLDVSGNGGGSVLLRSGRLLVDRSFMFADTLHMDGASPGLDLRVVADAVLTDGAHLTTDSLGGGRAGDLRLAAGSVHVDNAVIGSRVFPFAFGDGGNVILNVRTLMLTGGAVIDSSTFGGGRGGNLSVEATEAVSIAGRGSGLFSGTSGIWNAGNIDILAGIISIDEGRIQSIAERGSRGHAGLIFVGAGRPGGGGRLTLTGGAQIDSSTFGAGRGGDVTVVATDAISIAGRDREGNPSGVFSNTFDRGDAGRLSISSPRVRVDEGARITAETFGGGRGGNIDIGMLEGQLTLTGGGRISSSTFGAGPGGAVRLLATESLTISSDSPDSALSGLFSSAFSSGDAGRVEISAPAVSLEGGVVISTGTSGTGRGGDVVVASSLFGNSVVASRRLTLTGGSRISSSTDGAGPGGSIHVQTGSLELSHGGTITASSTGNGVAGTIQLQAGETFRSQNGRVTTATEGAGGGRIELGAGRLVQLQDSEVTTSIRGGEGDAGNLTLTAPSVIAEGSRVIAQAIAGMGGRIDITADVFLADPASRVSASSELGISGTVDIRAPVTSLSGTLAPLPQAFVNVAALLPARCAARLSGGQASSLVLGGRDGLPAEPGGVLPSPLVLDEQLVAHPALTGVP